MHFSGQDEKRSMIHCRKSLGAQTIEICGRCCFERTIINGVFEFTSEIEWNGLEHEFRNHRRR